MPLHVDPSELSAAEVEECARLLVERLVSFLDLPDAWNVGRVSLPRERDVSLRIALTLANSIVSLYECAPTDPQRRAQVARAAAVHASMAVREKFGGRTIWIDSAASRNRKAAETIIAAGMAAGRPLPEVFEEAGVSRRTGYRIRDRLLSRRPR